MSVTAGKPVTTDEIADRLSQISTVSRADTYAVLKDMAGVLADYMAQGRTVKIDGLGTFYYTANASKQGVKEEKDVNASQITGVRVRFIPEARRSGSGRNMVRSLISDNIFWMELPANAKTTDPEQGGGDSESPDEV
ncbi:HU family DNA-binding protein [Parabacteroides distasonis]|nr:HU family DNA-binding protein [Parabacteroides distasonis]MCC2779843.1 HU family DNA-binding protein [Parabacteroides distasonis]